MSRFDEQIISFDIESVLREYLGEYNQNRNSFYMKCPYCGRNNKFYIQKQYKYFTCFVCGEKGNLYKLIGFLKGVDQKQAFKFVHNLEKKYLNYNEQLQVKLVDDCKLFDQEFDFEDVDISCFKNIEEMPVDHEVKEYIERRELSDEMVQLFDLRYCEESRRLIFPIYFKDKIVGYQARDITNLQVPKILSSPGLPKEKILYNYNQLIYNLPQYVVITEGPVDCIKSYKHNSIALLGKTINQYQINLLLDIQTIKKVYIALDPEEANLRVKMMVDLSCFWETFLVPVELGTDFGMLSPYEIDFLLKNSKSVFDFDHKIII